MYYLLRKKTGSFFEGKKMNGKETHIRSLIKDQEQKIARAQERIAELTKQLEELSKPNPPQEPIKKDDHNYCGKILYPSKKAAASARKLINRDLTKMGKQPMRRSYFCTQCDAWHLTTIGHWTEIEQ